MVFYRSAIRLKDELWRQRLNPEPGSVLMWFDWMQYVTLPLANVSTSNLYYGAARMEVSVFGILLIDHTLVTRCRQPIFCMSRTS